MEISLLHPELIAIIEPGKTIHAAVLLKRPQGEGQNLFGKRNISLVYRFRHG